MTPPYLPDLGNGQYQNPILNADYSDPDMIRLGEDYWMTASSFSHSPGLPILHSRDLINWSLVNHALPALVPTEHFSSPRHGCGVWAPALRHHAGLFWIFYPDPDFGIYVITAKDPRGTWSTPRLIKTGRGLIDPCPLWDDDGQAYFIHGWAKSRAGINNLLTLHAMTPDATALLDEGTVVIDANLMPGWKTLEGPKLYKRDGWYWVFAPAGGVAEGYQAVFRSRSIRGPYEARNVLEQGSTPINGPHQGAWVDTPAGEYWFCHFQELPALGRVVHLQPMRWNEDGWPVMGNAPTGATRGEPVLRHTKPSLPPQAPCGPATSDDFDSPELGLQWQWECNPQPSWYSLTGRTSHLRLPCQPTLPGSNHWSHGHLLMQKLPAPAFTATARLELLDACEGDSVGLIVFGYDYTKLCLVRAADGLRLRLIHCLAANKAGTEQVLSDQPWYSDSGYLRCTLDTSRRCRFSHSMDGESWTELPHDFLVPSSHWVGAKVGLVASADTGATAHVPGGYADCDWFRING